MSEMTPKEALSHIEEPLTHIQVVPGGCPECIEALAVLRSLVEQPTVEEVRAFVQREYNKDNDSVWPDHYCALAMVLDFIDKKGGKGEH